jgi:protein-S-isoprenylcysteine O-methyltransferase Ste14
MLMPIVALLAYTVYLALAFGLRGFLHYRRTGTTGYVGLSGRPFSLEWSAGVLFAAAVVAGGLAPVLQLVDLVRPWEAVDGAPAHALGIASAVVGIAGTLWAQLAMGTSWRVGVDRAARTALVSKGPFRFVRNPIFTWMTFATAGLTLLAPNAVAFASLAALLVALEIQVRAVEEPYLLLAHGEHYRRYAAATGRFVPGLGRLK